MILPSLKKEKWSGPPPRVDSPPAKSDEADQICVNFTCPWSTNILHRLDRKPVDGERGAYLWREEREGRLGRGGERVVSKVSLQRFGR